MLTHEQIWIAVDRLARYKGLSVSALARKAGLDPTSFNKSKRLIGNDRPRWPSTESIAKILAATGESVESFVALMYDEIPVKSHPHLPLIPLAEARNNNTLNASGQFKFEKAEEVIFPNVRDKSAYAIEISGDSMLPLYRHGDIIIVSPAVQVRRGDRVVVRTRSGEVFAKELARQTHNALELHSFDPRQPDHIVASADLDWMAKIVWASQ